MLKTGLEFAPGTTEACQRLIVGMFAPGEILHGYRHARQQLKTGDLALVVSEQDPSGFNAMPRTECVKMIRSLMGDLKGAKMPDLYRVLEQQSAHGVVKLPFESDALWLVITRGQALPVICVLYAAPYETTTATN